MFVGWIILKRTHLGPIGLYNYLATISKNFRNTKKEMGIDTAYPLVESAEAMVHLVRWFPTI